MKPVVVDKRKLEIKLKEIEKMDFKFENGDEVKDVLTGFKGVIMTRCDYLTGCNRYGLLQKKLKEGKPADWVWMDEHILVKTRTKRVTLATSSKAGGSRPNSENAPQR